MVLQTSDRAFVYWQLPALSDSLCLRSVTVSPSSNGTAMAEEDHTLSRPVGGFWLSRFAPGSEVRAAIGEVSGDGFCPLLVARVLASGGDSDDTPAFDPPGSAADAELETAARSAAGL